ncbi:MAG: hypothetical protein JW384_03696 [Nitrosomonadaceae bacterium]|nr:hypothetical protein [Nitrosomonadaceae bacterium]
MISVGEARIATANNQVNMLLPLCRRLYYADVPVRRRICRAMVEGSVLYASELWAWGPRLVGARDAVGHMAQHVLGAQHSNRTIAMLEAEFLDVGALSTAKRLAWANRLQGGGHSPAKLMWNTSQPGGTALGRVKSELQAYNLSAEEWKQLNGTHRSELLLAWTQSALRAETANGDNVEEYMNQLWLTPGQRVGWGDASVGTRAFRQLRMGSFWRWPQLKHFVFEPQSYGCGFCKGTAEETVEHFLLDCPAWTTQRELLKLGELNSSPREEWTLALLGGRTNPENAEQAKTNAAKTVAYLEAVMPSRMADIRTRREGVAKASTIS